MEVYRHTSTFAHSFTEQRSFIARIGNIIDMYNSGFLRREKSSNSPEATSTISNDILSAIQETFHTENMLNVAFFLTNLRYK